MLHEHGGASKLTVLRVFARGFGPPKTTDRTVHGHASQALGGHRLGLAAVWRDI